MNLVNLLFIFPSIESIPKYIAHIKLHLVLYLYLQYVEKSIVLFFFQSEQTIDDFTYYQCSFVFHAAKFDELAFFYPVM